MTEQEDSPGFDDDERSDLGYVPDEPGVQHEDFQHQPDANASGGDPGDVLGLFPGAPEPAMLTELGSLIPAPHSAEDQELAYMGAGPSATAGGGAPDSQPDKTSGTTAQAPTTTSPQASPTPPPLDQGSIDNMMNNFEQTDHASTMALLDNLRV